MKLKEAKHLSAGELAGQLMMPALRIDFFNRNSRHARQLLRLANRCRPGGFILFGGHPADVVYWIRKLAAVSEIPNLFAADLERGAGGLFNAGTAFPHALAWGAANSPELARAAAMVIAREARAMGINTVFAPVLDLVDQPDNPIVNIRGFHHQPDVVAELGKIFIQTVQGKGLACVAKHYPGHGGTQVDSHLDLPRIADSVPERESRDLLPFNSAIAGDVKCIMSAHICFEDNPLPATFRPDVLRDRLRGQYGFQGLVFSDALNMKAINGQYEVLDQIRFGLKAGVDVFLMPENPDLFHTLLSELLEQDEELRHFAEQSVFRLFRLKKWLHRANPDLPQMGRIYKFIGSDTSEAAAAKLAQKAVTCLHHSKRFPINLTEIETCTHLIFSDFVPDSTPLKRFCTELDSFFGQTRTVVNPVNSDLDNYAATADLLLISLYARTFGGHRSQFDWEKIREAFGRLSGQSAPLLLLIFGNPFHLRHLPEWQQADAVLAMYSYVEASQVAALKALSSLAPVEGKLPVRLRIDKKSMKEKVLPARRWRLTTERQAGRNFWQVDELIQEAIAGRVFPGGVLLVAQRGNILHHKAYGFFDYPPAELNPRVREKTPYDLASLTKVLATTPAVLKLADTGKLELAMPLANFFPQLSAKPLGKCTIRELLLHRSGLPAWKPFYTWFSSAPQIVADILSLKLEYPTGSRTVYSDPGFILLGEIVRLVSGWKLDDFCREKIFEPLGFSSLKFGCARKKRRLPDSPPTGFDDYRGRIVCGEVNDTNCFTMGGVAGHAGLFGCAEDVAGMAQLFLNRGLYNGRWFLSRKSVMDALRKVDASAERWLGWDRVGTESSAGTHFSNQSFGHLAFTGPSVWADPRDGSIVVFLCNRTHPDPKNEAIRKFRPILHNAIRAVIG